VPEAGAEFKVMSNDRLARQEAERLGQEKKLEALNRPQRASLEDLLQAAQGPSSASSRSS